MAPLAVRAERLLTASAEIRVVSVIFLGLAVFQSSQSLSTPKIAYLLLFALAVCAALFRLWYLRSTQLFHTFMPILGLSCLLLLLIATSAVVARINGATVSLWLRDASPYLLVSFVPLLAVDAASGLRPSVILPLFVVAGSLTTLSYSAEWLSRRHLAQLGITKVGLPSFLLPVAILSFAVAAAILGAGKRWLWAAYALVLAALMALTGNRSSLVAIVSPVAIIIASKRIAIARAPRLFAAVTLTTAAVAALTLLVSALAHADIGYMVGRFESIPQLLVRPWTDQSFQLRATQTADAIKVLTSSPVFGSGPGHIYHWKDWDGSLKSGFDIDTGLAYPAKFGLIGVVVLVIYAAGYFRFVRTLISAHSLDASRAALIGYLAFTAVWATLEPPLEDKGFSFGLLFLLALSSIGLHLSREKPA